MGKIAFITGIAGQDGSYLAEFLLSKGYEVHGTIRRNSTPEHQESRIAGLDIQTYYSDLSDGNLGKLLSKIKPDEIYNLAAQSHVRISFDIPQYTGHTNAIGVLNILEAYRENCPDARFYQASSSEMFGNSIDLDGRQRITTPMRPVSPYGAAKLYGFNMVQIYRDSYNLHACNGVLFNHESPRRASNFVTSKVVKTAVEIYKGKATKLELGNMDSKRDWGHSKDYVRAMHAILNHSVPADWVVATGETRSVRDMCEYVFNKLGMDYRDYVVQNPKYLRPNELNLLKGDSQPIREVLKWKPEYTFETLMDEMIESWMQFIR